MNNVSPKLKECTSKFFSSPGGGKTDQWQTRTDWRWFTFLTSLTELPSIPCSVIAAMHCLCVCAHARVCAYFLSQGNTSCITCRTQGQFWTQERFQRINSNLRKENQFFIPLYITVISSVILFSYHIQEPSWQQLLNMFKAAGWSQTETLVRRGFPHSVLSACAFKYFFLCLETVTKFICIVCSRNNCWHASH